MANFVNYQSWHRMLSFLIMAAILTIPTVVLAEPASGNQQIHDCGLDLSVPVSIADIGAAVKDSGVREDALNCYIVSLLAAGIAPPDIAEGLLLAGYEVFDVVRAIVIVGGAAVVVDVVARVNMVLGPTVSQTARDAVAAAVLEGDAEAPAAVPAYSGLDTSDCDLGLSQPISVEDIGLAVKAAGVRDDLLDCYVASLLKAGAAPADIAEGLLMAGYVVFDVVRALVSIGGPDVVDDVVVRANTVYCQMLTKGSTHCGSTITQTVADAALVAPPAGPVVTTTDSMPEVMALVTAGEIAAGVGRWEPSGGGAGGLVDACSGGSP